QESDLKGSQLFGTSSNFVHIVPHPFSMSANSIVPGPDVESCFDQDVLWTPVHALHQAIECAVQDCHQVQIAGLLSVAVHPGESNPPFLLEPSLDTPQW